MLKLAQPAAQVMWDFQATAGMSRAETREFREQWQSNWQSFNGRADAPADRTPVPSTHKAGKLQKPQDPHKTTKPIRLSALGLLRALDHILTSFGAPLSSFLTHEALEEIHTARKESQQKKMKGKQAVKQGQSTIPPAQVPAPSSIALQVPLPSTMLASQVQAPAQPAVLVPPLATMPRILVLHTDEGSSNLAAVNHLQRRTMLLLQRDPAHREWNDIRNAVKQANCNSLVLMLTFTFNTPYGPWEGGKWHKSNQQACEVINELGPADALCAALRQSILRDKAVYNDLGELYTAGNKQQIRHVLDPDDFKHKGKKISLTRWFDFFGRLEERLPCWHSFYLVMLFQGIASGIITSREDFPTLLRRGPVAADLDVPDHEPDGPPAPHGTTADQPKDPTARDSVNNLRQKCAALRVWHTPYTTAH